MDLDDRIRSALADFDAAVRAAVPTPPLQRRRRHVAPLLAVAASLAVISLGVGWLNRPTPLPPVATQPTAATTTTVPTVLVDLPALVAPVGHEEYAARAAFLEDLLAPTLEVLESCLQTPVPEAVVTVLTDPLVFEGATGGVLHWADPERLATHGFEPREVEPYALGPCESILSRPSPDLAARDHLDRLWAVWVETIQFDVELVDPQLLTRYERCLLDTGFPDDLTDDALRELSVADNRMIGAMFVDCAGELLAALQAVHGDTREVFLEEHAGDVDQIADLIAEAVAGR